MKILHVLDHLQSIADSLDFYRTPAGTGWIHWLPAGSQLDVIRGLRRRLREVLAVERPDVSHAHSACLNGVPAESVVVMPKAVDAASLGAHKALDPGPIRQRLGLEGRAVLELIANPGLQQHLRANGPRYIRQERTWARVVPRYRAAYQQALCKPIAP